MEKGSLNTFGGENPRLGHHLSKKTKGREENSQKRGSATWLGGYGQTLKKTHAKLNFPNHHQGEAQELGRGKKSMSGGNRWFRLT